MTTRLIPRTKTYATAKALTTSLVNAGTVIDCSGFTELVIYIDFDPATSGDAINSQVLFSHDQTDFHAEPDEVVAVGIGTQLNKERTFVSTVGGSNKVPAISIPVADRWARIFLKDDVGTTGTADVTYTLSNIS